jgi:TonB family protein
MRIAYLTVIGVALLMPKLFSGQDVDHPLQVGGNVTPPTITKFAKVKISRSMKEKNSRESVVVHVVVDVMGMPQHLSVAKGIDVEYDAVALATVEKYRFAPAKRDGQPVAVMINISLDFNH